MSVLELCDVSRVYGDGPAEVHALRGVSLSVTEGELVAVMGPSGVGQEHPADYRGDPRGAH
ncbi:MAG TPA: hypothetical protein VG184_07945 [Acidimicrobiales bacterium]|jgi:putative ABC transport system ATP-binding protein|nr:hypothetical protein [Acidimicrobiales bacterium]